MPYPRPATRWRFEGWIAGAGTTGGTRLVLGHWPVSPLGPFSDVMVAHPDGRRELLAPSERIAEFVSATYTFEAVRVVPVVVEHDPDRAGEREARRGDRWTVRAGPLQWCLEVGARHPLGQVLRAVPAPVATSWSLARFTDPVARATMRGVRTRGSAGQDRTEWYAARDLHRLADASAQWDRTDLGTLAPVDPPPGFGFSSAPRMPSLARVVSTVLVPVRAPASPVQRSQVLSPRRARPSPPSPHPRPAG